MSAIASILSPRARRVVAGTAAGSVERLVPVSVAPQAKHFDLSGARFGLSASR